MDLRLNFTQEVITTTVTSMTSAPTTMIKVINELTSTQGFLKEKNIFHLVLE